MTTYFVSTDGSNSNNGLGPDASHGTNKPWLTLAKAIGTGSSLSAGDEVYVAPGVYVSAETTVASGISSYASPTAVRGDPLNKQGFKNGSGVRTAPGLCWITPRTSVANMDADLVRYVQCINAPNEAACHGMQFYDLVLDGQALYMYAVKLDPTYSRGWRFERCRIYGGGPAFSTWTSAWVVDYDLVVKNCIIFSTGVVFDSLSGTAPASADIDLNILFESNLIFGAGFHYQFQLSPSGGNLAGGVRWKGNTFIGGGFNAPFHFTAGRNSTVTPCRYEGNIIYNMAFAAVNCGTSGQMVDDGYNRIAVNIAPTNHTYAGTTKTGIAFDVVLPDLVSWGLEMPRGDWFGWTDSAASEKKFSAWTNTSTDFRGRTARPWGSGASIGYMQAQEVAKDTSGAITGGGSNSLKLTGKGEFSFYIPVDATGFTLSVTTKSTSYGGANYPQMIVMGNADIGVSSDTTATASSATEQVVTTSTITPTAKGVMEVRLISRSTSTTSTTHFDIVAAA